MAPSTNAPLMVRVDDAAKTLSVCRRTVFQLISSGQLRAYKIRGATVIRRADLDRYIAALPRVPVRYAA